MKKFGLQIEEWAKRTKGRQDEFFRKLSQELASEVINGTPVKTGFARRSWYPSINNEEAGGNGGKGFFASFVAQANTLRAGDKFYILNNADYIRRLEYGHSKEQAPHGMVRVTLAKADTIADDILREMEV